MTVDLASAAVRALTLVALLQAGGVALFLAAFDRGIGSTRRPVRRIGLAAAGVAAIALVAFYVLEAARMAGDWSGVFDVDLLALAWEMNAPPATTRAAGLLLVAFALLRGHRWTGVGGAVLLAASFGLTGHTADEGVAAAARAVVALHVLLATFWFGSLIPLILVSGREMPEHAGTLVARFTSLATWSVPLIAIAGLGLAAWLGVRWETLGQPYGAILVAKALLFAGLMALAAANKWRFGPGLATQRGAARAFRRSVAVELVLIVVVLGATAVLTTFYSVHA